MKEPTAQEFVLLPPLNRNVCRLVMGTSFWSSLPQAEVDQLYDTYVECGGNCFDTALVYHDAVQALGAWVKSRGNRKSVIIHAKGAHHETVSVKSSHFEYHRSRVDPDSIRHDLELTLQKLQTDYVDIFTLHRDDPDQPVGPIIECLAAEQKAGRIRAFGASNWKIPRIREANAYAEAHGLPGFILNSPNLALAFSNEPSWPNCETACDRFSRTWHSERSFPLFAWSALALGFFSGNYRPKNELTTEEFEKLMADRWTADVVRVYYSPRNFDRLARVRELAREKGTAPTIIALAWTLCEGSHVFAVVGPRNVEQIRELFTSFSIGLTKAEAAWLNLELQQKPDLNDGPTAIASK